MKKIWLALIVIAAAVVAVSLIALPRSSEWTTDSPEALAEFTAAMDAKMKLYRAEAEAHLERAVELDPNFVIAKLFLADHIRYDDEDRATILWNDVLTSDPSKLTPREVFFVDRNRAIQEKRWDDAAAMIDQYLTEHPDDPYVLHEKALRLWLVGDFDEAEKVNRRIIDIAPNWVIAYNQLGYIAMSRGRFVEAEEYFTSYRFVAPDQANPHDSLGELYIILGRDDEAEISLRQSIDIKPDFWDAYDHLALARIQADDFVGAEAVHEEAKATGECPEYWDQGIECLIEIARLERADDWQGILDSLDVESPCLEGHSSGYAQIARHSAACRLGNLETARAIEAKWGESFEAANELGKDDKDQTYAVLNHLRGVRLAFEGDFDAAVEAFREADEHLTYMQARTGLFKLANRLNMVEALFAAGDDAKAHKVLSKVRSVNPGLAQDFEEDGLKILGLERE